MKRNAQFKFDSKNLNYSLAHGGELRKKRSGRGARPLSSKEPLHLVIKGTLARKEWSFRLPKNHKIVSELIYKLSNLYGIRIEQKAIANDHIHFVLRVKNRALYKRFIRRLSGQIAQRVVTDAQTSAKSLKALGLKFFKHRPFSRVVRGRKAHQTVIIYVKLNEQEALGNIPYRKRRTRGLEPDDWHHLWC